MNLLSILWTILVITFSNYIYAQSEASTSLFQYLSANETLEITLTTNLKNLLKNKEIPAYQKAKWETGQNKNKVAWQVEVKPRGNLRRKICYLPPLKIKFPKTLIEEKGWSPHRKLKLVSMCKNQKSAQDLIIKEYLAYKMYNILSDYSFRVQLVHVIFIDAENKMKPIESIGFFIEPVEEMAERLQCQVITPRVASPNRVTSNAFDLISVFQFMIGNTDWSIRKLHNLKLLYSPEMPLPIPIPYDFDHAGLVDPPYAAPHESIPINHISERYFMGVCRPENQYEVVFQLFQEKKIPLLKCLEADALLTPASKKLAVRYLNDFFEILDNPQKRKKLILKDCK